MAEVGHFRGSKHDRYWVGACTCGSGKEGRELHDARGIYCGIACAVCKKEDTYRKDVFADPDYWHDEPIEDG